MGKPFFLHLLVGYNIIYAAYEKKLDSVAVIS